MAALGSKAQEKIAVYRATGDLKTRDEAFSLLWQMLLHDGEIKAHIKFNELKLPRWKRPDSKQVAEEATASLLAQSLTALTNKFDPNRAGLRTYLSWKILSKIGDHGRKKRWRFPPQPLDGNAAATLGDDAVIGAPAGRTNRNADGKFQRSGRMRMHCLTPASLPCFSA